VTGVFLKKIKENFEAGSKYRPK